LRAYGRSAAIARSVMTVLDPFIHSTPCLAPHGDDKDMGMQFADREYT